MININKMRLCYQDQDNLERSDYTTKYERDNTGGKIKVTRYADGTSKYHFGGPCGSQCYDENGEEC